MVKIASIPGVSHYTVPASRKIVAYCPSTQGTEVWDKGAQTHTYWCSRCSMCRRVHLFIIGKTRQKLGIVLAQIFFFFVLYIHQRDMCVQVIFVPFLPPPSHFYTPPPGTCRSVKSAVFLFIGDFPFFEMLLSSSFFLRTLMSRNAWDGSNSHCGSLSHISWPRLVRGSEV